MACSLGCGTDNTVTSKRLNLIKLNNQHHTGVLIRTYIRNIKTNERNKKHVLFPNRKKLIGVVQDKLGSSFMSEEMVHFFVFMLVTNLI